MLRDITLGQYYPGESFIHKLDPRIKIIATLIYIVSLFVMVDFISYIFTILYLAACIIISRVPLKFMLKGMKMIVFIIALTFLINMFMTKGHPIAEFWIFTITREGLYQAVFMALRLFMLILGSSLLTLTTKPISLTDGIESLLNPFKRVGVPAHELAMMMSIALRFIPTLLEETDKIMKAQMARGADFESGNLMRRAKGLIPILVPLFISAFRRADELAMAMEARCYRGGENRTRMHQLKYTYRDWIAMGVTLLMLAILIAQRVLF